MSARFFVPVGLLLLVVCGAVSAASLESTIVLERGPHEQVVQTVRPAVDEQGNKVWETNTFTQLQTGVNRWSEVDGAWVPAVAQIERVNGTLVARETQHQVIFGDRADAADGTIDLAMVEWRFDRRVPPGSA